MSFEKVEKPVDDKITMLAQWEIKDEDGNTVAIKTRYKPAYHHLAGSPSTKKSSRELLEEILAKMP